MSPLNPQQTKAARASGSVSITAGAGTGKTHVLSERYRYLLTSHGWTPLNIVAVTFTEKAADELSARIRGTIAKGGATPDIIAEVDAAQISTIHALAARICRDFYDLAGIPADFRLMDENESALWTLGATEDAIGAVCEKEAYELGYSFLLGALTQLLSDPFGAGHAFSNCSEDGWRRLISESAEQSCRDFTDHLRMAPHVQELRELLGPDGDAREEQRRAAVEAIDEVLAGDFVAADRLDRINLRGGSKKNWPEGEFETVKALLERVRKDAREFILERDLGFGDADEQLLERVQLLRSAFENARQHLSNLKAANRYVDYNDLELCALKILRSPDAIDHYRRRWKAFLVDEFQDTSPIQAELLRLLTSEANLTIVGDEKQSIYGFRGADAEVFGRFRVEIAEKGGEQVALEETYRTNSGLVGLMNKIFEPLLGSLQVPLTSSRLYEGAGPPKPVQFGFVEANRDKKGKQSAEARYIARAVREMVDGKVLVFDKEEKRHRPVEFRDFAVLTRVWDSLEVYGDALAEAGVPAVNVGGGSLLRTREFKDAYGLITFIADQSDDLSLAAVLRSPFFAVSDGALYDFARTVGRDTSWWPVLREANGIDPYLAAARDRLTDLLKERVHHSPEGLLRLAARETGYAAVVANLPHGQRREADWSATLRFVRGLQEKGWEDLFSVARYLRIAVRSELVAHRPAIESGDAVSLMTIHAAKGLEWPVVFVPDLSRKFRNDDDPLAVHPEIGVAFCWEGLEGEEFEPAIYKVIKSLRSRREDAERRRLLYVAITRAGDFVRLSSAEGEGFSLDLLRPGLEAAGVLGELIAYAPSDFLLPAPGEPAPFPEYPGDVEAVNIATESVMATGIATYATCPRKYKFQYVDGHPGLGEGAADAALIGTLAHLALELETDSPGVLALNSGCEDPELLAKALEQSRNFREHDAFAIVRDLPAKKEFRFSSTVGGIRLFGIADLVGDDFVLDYKTDAVADPEKHSLQLWGYARALGKEKAYIAYLRHNRLHEITREDLARLDGVGIDLISRLRSGDFAPNASESTCLRCTYKSICVSGHNPGGKDELV